MKRMEEKEFQNCHTTYQLLHLVRGLHRLERKEKRVYRDRAGLGQTDKGREGGCEHILLQLITDLI